MVHDIIISTYDIIRFIPTWYDIVYDIRDIDMILCPVLHCAPPPPSAAPAAAVVSLHRFLDSPALVLLLLIHSLLNLSASAMESHWRLSGGGPDRSAISRCPPRKACCRCPGPAACRQSDGGGASKMQIVLEAVWNRGVTIAADEAQNDGGAPQHVCHRAHVEAGQARVAGRVIEHGQSNLLHDAVWRLESDRWAQTC
jgi:hypothetical protein